MVMTMTPLLVLSKTLALVWQHTNSAVNNDNEPWFEFSSGDKSYDTAYQSYQLR
jgi:hypothetical protein